MSSGRIKFEGGSADTQFQMANQKCYAVSYNLRTSVMSYPLNTVRYVENEVIMRSPEWLVPLMYEHLLKSIRRAIVQIEVGDLAGRSASLDKATQIVAELLCSLDRENGGPVADSLASLYAYFTIELLDAGRGETAGSLPQLVALVEELHGAWVQAAEKVSPRGGAAAMATAAA